MKKELVVGTVMIIAMVLLGTFTIFISDVKFGETETMHIRLKNIEGLKKGDEVQVSGHEYGKVRDITLEDGRIVVEAELSGPLAIREDYKVRIRSASPLGGRMVSIDPGSPDQTELPSDRILEGTHIGADIIDSIHELVMQIKEGDGTIAKLINDPEVYDNLLAFTESLKTVSEGKGFVGKMLSEDSEQMYTKASEAVNALHSITTGIDEGKGTLGKLAKDDALYESAKNLLANAEAISSDLRAGKGTIGKLLTKDDIYDNVNEAFAGISSITGELKKGESAGGRLIYDKQMGEDLATAVADVRSIAADAASGTGTIGKLLKDESLFDEAKAMIETLSNLVDGLSKGEGTLGKLLTDSSLYDKAENLITQLRQAAEDAREQAPVTAFGNILLGGFR